MIKVFNYVNDLCKEEGNKLLSTSTGRAQKVMGLNAARES